MDSDVTIANVTIKSFMLILLHFEIRYTMHTTGELNYPTVKGWLASFQAEKGLQLWEMFKGREL